MERKTEIRHVLPADIERTSMGIIAEELKERGIVIPEEHAAVVRRVIHTTADFDYTANLRFTDGAADEALRTFLQGGAVIITDTNMALAGISKPSLKKLGAEAHCFMADPKIAEMAKAQNCTVMNLSIVEENQVLRKWYERNGAVHTGTEKFAFFPFTCGYMTIRL